MAWCGKPSGHLTMAASSSSKLWIAPGRSGRSLQAIQNRPWPFHPQPVNALHGWVDNHTILAADMLNAYWLSDEDSAPGRLA